ncbi:MAG: thiamine pyrophosphate-dependent dehydrogenase E1 component subunit alpha [Deltaproteobacteria bacterium]|nr:thiamine pyrophosphate-dependent dehydrogenase E1 component subunit alpha [Deltaproteobacteria bacterium]
MSLSNEKLLELYRKMLVVRSLEELHDKLLQEGKIHLMGHFGTGQEAVAIGVTGPLRKEDILFGTHRGVGEYIGKGMTPLNIWAEYLGKKSGLCNGKATLHLGDKENNIPPVVSSLGSDFSMAVGAALAAKMKNTGQVILYFVGEGTCNQADAHPAMNMAALWNLPVVFAVCNNQYCEMTFMGECYTTPDVAPRAECYGIPTQIIDGQDIEVVYDATQNAVEHARSGNGPYLVEAKTFRMALHFSGDPGGYVDQAELEKWAKRDPIDLCRNVLLEREALTADQDQSMRNEVTAQNDEAFETAFASPDPTAKDLFEDVYETGGIL